MLRFISNATKFRHRIRQSEVQLDPDSLSARAFRQRVLGEEVPTDLSSSPVSLATRTKNSVRVATYQDTSIQLRRKVVRFMLTFVAPVLALLLIGAVVFTTINQNSVSAPIVSESIALDNLPVPAGVRPIARARQLNQRKSDEIFYSSTLPAYNLTDFKGVVTYISPQPVEDLIKFYNARLIESKPTPWQIYGKPGRISRFYVTLYIRALASNRANSLEGVIVQLEPVDRDLLKEDPDYYDKQARPGETVILMSKSWLVPKV